MAGPSLEAIYGTFTASVRSVGTAITLASVGFYLHRRGYVVGDGKRTLALISQQVTFPLFLFTKILYCNQDWSEEPCPDVTRSLDSVWMLLFWPIFVVSVGIFVGFVVAKVCGAPKQQIRSILAACGLANSTGLPITLLTVVHQNFPETSDLGRIDPTLFLSIYLLLYPVLQWGIGGWLLSPGIDDEKVENKKVPPPSIEVAEKPSHQRRHSGGGFITDTIRLNVLNNKEAQEFYNMNHHRRGLTSTDEGMYVSDADLPSLVQQWADQIENENEDVPSMDAPSFDQGDAPSEDTPLMAQVGQTFPPVNPALTKSAPAKLIRMNSEITEYETDSFWETVKNVLGRCLQPPVVGALLGIFCAITPLRGVFVDIIDRSAHAPLQWLFDGLYSVGLTAVPINMMILGCNLSASQHSMSKTKDFNDPSTGLLAVNTMVGVLIGKMLVMPTIGIATGWLLKNYVWDIPDDIDGAFYLVLMIVFLTPTANNVMVMVELSGANTKQGIAMCIALQYAVAPVILSLTMTVAIGVASGWS